MRVSLNEIETTLRKAAVGAGVDEGSARELAIAGRWLTERGVDGVAAVLASLTSAPGSSVPIRNAGPGVMDQLLIAPGVQGCLRACDAPLVVVGLCGAAADQFGIAAHVRSANWAAVISHRSLSMTGVVPPAPADIEVVITTDPIDQPESFVDQPSVDTRVWAGLEQLAARTYVPTSPESSAGAGPDGHP